MKKKCFFKSLALCLSMMSVLSLHSICASAVTPYSCGDVDGNGSIGIADLIMLERFLNGEYVFNTSALSAAEIYTDNMIDAVDAAVLLSFIAGNISSLPYTP